MSFTRIFGQPPSAAKEKGSLMAERIETPLGSMLAIADDSGLRLLEFVDRRALERELSILRTRLRTNVVPGEHRYLDTVRAQLANYFSGKNLEFDVPLVPVGSPFQLRAWKLLQTIPVGETRSYSWMAKKLGDVEMRRAVGRANGENMMCIVIPCHRVIRADCTLCGYGGGLWRKKWLLEHERKLVSR
jgi:AraC family transcriptional regulator of adaptative response/methylated-DNA-[protein]-cysteine methyltransferase